MKTNSHDMSAFEVEGLFGSIGINYQHVNRAWHEVLVDESYDDKVSAYSIDFISLTGLMAATPGALATASRSYKTWISRSA